MKVHLYLPQYFDEVLFFIIYHLVCFEQEINL